MKTKNLLIAVSLIAVLAAVPLFAMAQNTDDHRARGYHRGGGQGRMGDGMGPLSDLGCPLAALNLSTDQQALFEDMREAARNFHETQWQVGWKVRQEMLDELEKGNHDLSDVAEELKTEHQAAFEAMIDARAAFFASLTEAQVQQMKQSPAARRGGQGRGQGKGCQRGGFY